MTLRGEGVRAMTLYNFSKIHLEFCFVWVEFLGHIQSSAMSLQTLCEVDQVKVDFAHFRLDFWKIWKKKSQKLSVCIDKYKSVAYHWPLPESIEHLSQTSHLLIMFQVGCAHAKSFPQSIPKHDKWVESTAECWNWSKRYKEPYSSNRHRPHIVASPSYSHRPRIVATQSELLGEINIALE